MHASPRLRPALFSLLALGCVFAATALSGCGEEETPEMGAPGEVEAPPPEHGGTVVVAGGILPVEVVTHESGQVYAYVRGEGPPEAEELSITVDVPTEGRSTGRPVRLRWSAARGRWEGRVRRLTIIPGPLDIHVVIGGVPMEGHVDIIIVAPAIVIHVDEHHHHHRKHRRKHKHRRRHGHGHGHRYH